jgi:hypothetical protein
MGYIVTDNSEYSDSEYKINHSHPHFCQAHVGIAGGFPSSMHQIQRPV